MGDLIFTGTPAGSGVLRTASSSADGDGSSPRSTASERYPIMAVRASDHHHVRLIVMCTGCGRNDIVFVRFQAPDLT